MERYRREMETIEGERINFLNKIDLVQPSFEEQHQLEVRKRQTGVRRGYGNCRAAPVQHSTNNTLFKRERFIGDKLAKRQTNLTTRHCASPYYSYVPHISVGTLQQAAAAAAAAVAAALVYFGQLCEGASSSNVHAAVPTPERALARTSSAAVALATCL